MKEHRDRMKLYCRLQQFHCAKETELFFTPLLMNTKISSIV